MNSVLVPNRVLGAGGHAHTERDTADMAPALAGHWPHLLLLGLLAGSAGAVELVDGYGPLVPHFGTSLSVADFRPVARDADDAGAMQFADRTAPSALPSALTLPVPDQVREALAALSLSKAQLADVLGVSRPTLYEWLDGKEPNAANARRLTNLLHLLATAGVSSSRPLSPRLLRQPLRAGEPSLIDALGAQVIDEPLVSHRLREARALGVQIESRRAAREDRLRSLGFDDPSDQQRREQLARNVAMQDWPKI